jgi:hypothetical protein
MHFYIFLFASLPVRPRSGRMRAAFKFRFPRALDVTIFQLCSSSEKLDPAEIYTGFWAELFSWTKGMTWTRNNLGDRVLWIILILMRCLGRTEEVAGGDAFLPLTLKRKLFGGLELIIYFGFNAKFHST